MYLTHSFINKLNFYGNLLISIKKTKRIISSPLFQPDPNKLNTIKHQLEHIMVENILPFWYPKVIDFEDGGYLLNHDIKGNWKGKTDKCIVAQARTMSFFSMLAKTDYGAKEHLSAASYGYEFITTKMWDKEFGGFYWEVDSTARKVLKPDKHLYGQAYGLFALSEYAKATKEQQAFELACELFKIIEIHYHDKKFGGYSEFYKRDWSSKDDNILNYMNVESSIKQYNTHLHLLEAFTSFYNLTKEGIIRERLIELIFILSNSILRKTAGACTDKHLFNWVPLYEVKDFFVNYGHDIENIWMLIEALIAINIPNYIFLDLYRTLFFNSFKYGFDKKNGGFYYGGPLNAPADKLGKIWWVQAEGLVSALVLYNLTHEQIYFDCFLKTLDWINKRQIDWEYGDWYSIVTKNGKPLGDKISNNNGAWKTPYHNGRAIIKCLELIKSLSEINSTRVKAS